MDTYFTDEPMDNLIKKLVTFAACAGGARP